MIYTVLRDTLGPPLAFYMIKVDHVTGATGLNPLPSVQIKKAGGSWGSPAGAVSEAGFGWYEVAPHVADRSAVGLLRLHASAAGCDPCDIAYMVVDPRPVNVVQVNGSPATVSLSIQGSAVGRGG